MAPRRRSVPLVLRGSLVVWRRRCGKPGCRCVDGPPHASPALSYSVGGRTHLLLLRREDVPIVRTALRRYQRVLRELERRVQASATALRIRITREKAMTRGARR